MRGHGSSSGETGGRRERSLYRASSQIFSYPQFVAGVRAYDVTRHELVRDLSCELGVQAATNVDLCQFLVPALVVRLQF
jgi:hypothetical protein